MTDAESREVFETLDDATDIDRQLAQVNLLRIRGQFEEARLRCLKLLNDFPQSAAAHTLMGDICVDKDDLAQAVEWYDMALGIIPESVADQKKLESVRKRLKDSETADTAAMLGLPTSRPKVGMFAAAFLALFVVVALGSYFAGRQMQAASHAKEKQVVDAPIHIPGTEPTVVNRGSQEGESNIEAIETPRNPTPSRVEVDRQLLGSLVPGAPEGVQMLEAMLDPRTNLVWVTAECPQDGNPRDAAAHVGTHALAKIENCPVATVRILQNGTVTLIADVRREAVVQTEVSEGRVWVDAVLSNVWPPTEPTEPNGQP
ncbi:MAG: hypothetical protein AMXMBFR81_05870 [Chthonomonas sp.]|nr:hypothetical protein [Fimbriimonadaceae bacterium]